MHDSFCSPLARADAALFHATGVNLPAWWPTRACATPIWMVCGAPIDPLDSPTDEALAEAYYAAVEELFEAHKGQHPAYAQRTLEMVEVDHSSHAKKARDVGPHIFTTRLALGFALVFGGAYMFRRHFLRFSTLDPFLPPSFAVLAMHVAGTVGWTLTSANLTVKGFHRRHRQLGYLAIVCCALMSVSAYRLSLESARDAAAAGGFAAAAHAAFHAFSNMQIAGIVPLLLAYAIRAAKVGDGQEHQRYMAMTHVLIGINFLPRVTAALFRYLLPYLSRSANFSLACALQWQMQLSSSSSCKLRRQLGAANAFVAATSFLALVAVAVAPGSVPELPLCPEPMWWRPNTWRSAHGECRLAEDEPRSSSSSADLLTDHGAIAGPLICAIAGYATHGWHHLPARKESKGSKGV